MATICKKEDSINRLSTNITYALKHNGINLKDFDKALIER